MSTPKEKAIELYEKYIGNEGSLHIQLKLTGFTEVKRKGKKHSLIAVDEILNIDNIKPYILHKEITKYYQEVKQEIEKI